MHPTFDTILEQKGLVVGRSAMHRQNVSAVQVQCCRQCSKRHPLRRKQLIVLEPHSPAEFLARSLGHLAVVVSAHRR